MKVEEKGQLRGRGRGRGRKTVRVLEEKREGERPNGMTIFRWRGKCGRACNGHTFQNRRKSPTR